MDTVSTTVPARTGLVGHPSDAFGGAVLATPIRELAATVTVEMADTILVGDRSFPDLAALLRSGHDSETKLLTAAVARLASWLGDAPRSGFRITWTTTIPRSVGLAGSSALVIATLRSIASLWEVEIADDTGPVLALEAETDLLAIAAGPQDRIVQWHEETMLMDFASSPTSLHLVHPPEPVELFICWTTAPTAPSHATHAPLQQRRDEHGVRVRMDALADLARLAAGALQTGDTRELGRCMDAGFEHRRALVPLDPAHVEMVEGLRELGAAATYTGSGGAVVALAPDVAPLRSWAAQHGLGHVSTVLA